LDDAVWYAETVGCHNLATERMKEIGSEYAGAVIDSEVHNINPNSLDNVDDISESIRSLGEIYDFDVSDDLQRISEVLGYVEQQAEEAHERQRFERSYGESKKSIFKAFDSDRAPTEAEALSDLFKDL